MTPNRIKIVFDAGTAEIYGDIMSDMLTVYANHMYDRQKEAKEKLAKVDLDDPDRKHAIGQACFEHDDAAWRLSVCDKIEAVFRGKLPNGYQQPAPERK